MTSLEQITRAAELRADHQTRRADGSYFTDADVAQHLARRAIGAYLLEAIGVSPTQISEGLADGFDAIKAIEAHIDTHEQRARLTSTLSSLEVLDPTCGAGSFLIAAWCAMLEVEQACGLGAVVHGDQIRGVDCDAQAASACRMSLAATIAPERGVADIRVADAQEAGALPAADILLGNPPYVRASTDAAGEDLGTRSVPNRSAWIVERALHAARPGARAAFVLPVSTACTDAFAPARHAWSRACDEIHTSHFDTIPSTLFTGVVQRLSIFEGRLRDARVVNGEVGGEGASTRPATWWTSQYHRWRRDERAGLLERVRHMPMPPQQVGGSIPKIGTRIEAGLLARIFSNPGAGRLLVPRSGAPDGANRIWYKRRWSYFLLFTDFMPGMWDAQGEPRPPTEFKALDVVPELDAQALLSIFSSTLFWWYFSVFTDNRNINRRDIEAFPVPDLDPRIQAQLVELGHELMVELRACSEVRECTYRSIGTIRNTYFRQGATRPVLDRIDAVLAEAYGMDAAELEFVLGFERRFRGGVSPDGR